MIKLLDRLGELSDRKSVSQVRAKPGKARKGSDFPCQINARTEETSRW